MSGHTEHEPSDYLLPVVTQEAAEALQSKARVLGDEFYNNAQDQLEVNNPLLHRIIGQYMTLLCIEKNSPEAERASMLLVLTHELLAMSAAQKLPDN